MKYIHLFQNYRLSHNVIFALLAAFVVATMIALPNPAFAAQIEPPPVPENIQVPEGNKLFLVGHATGTQNYICLPAESGVAYKLFTPQATLFDDAGKPKELSTHYFSPNPFENGKIRATWQDSKDSSLVWGEVKPGNASSDPNYVEPGAIPWLLVTVVGSQEGPTGGKLFAEATYIQRLNTSGGVAPSTGCATTEDIGNSAFVPYTTDYYFYRSANK